MIRFTKENVKKVLANNDGFTDRTYHKEENFEEENLYTIKNGKLLMHSIEKGALGNSGYDSMTECDMDQTIKFLRERKNKLIITA